MIGFDYYAPWEWQPIERMAHGCCDVEIRDEDNNVREICSCDYWWFSKEEKEKYISFRFM